MEASIASTSENKKIRKDQGKYKFPCTFDNCTKVFNRKWKLMRHHYSHTNERPFACEYEGCDKTYQSKAHVDRHMKCFHNREEYALHCPIPGCLTTFTSKSSLQKHCDNHDRKKYQCSVCDVTFLNEKRLTIHENAHKGILPFSCEVCNCKWRSMALLRRHMKSHKKKICPYDDCDVSTDSWHQLRTHQRLMHFVAYVCDFCKKEFVNKSIMREHISHHLPRDDREIYTCPFKPCSRQYFHKRNLDQHKRQFHKQERFYCGIGDCRCSYTSPDKMWIHRRRLHKVSLLKEKIVADLVERTSQKYEASDGENQEDSREESEDSIYPGHYLMLVVNKDHT